MSIAKTQVVPRTAAVIAGMGLVLTSFAPVMQAQSTTTTTTTTTTSSAPFMRSLTVGSTGADVQALQAWLMTKGFSIPAGATGYFGAQTKAAVAAFQAANGIVPAAGYFGPVTRAKVNALLTEGTVTNPNPNPGNSGNGIGSSSFELRGGEANLTKFDLRRESATGNEGEEDVKVATAQFNVEDADVRIERLDLRVAAGSTSLDQKPWKYFDRVMILSHGKEIASEDVHTSRDWDKISTGVYSLSLTNLKQVVREGDRAELTIAVDVNDSIDSQNLAQKFNFSVENRGIRAVDAAGIQQYVGNGSDVVSFGFAAEESGDLKVRTSSNSPRSDVLIADKNGESDEYDVFGFDIKNSDDADAILNELTIAVTDLGTGIAADSVIRHATLTVDGDNFDGEIGTSSMNFDDLDLTIDGNDTATFKLSVTLARNAAATPIAFEVQSANIDAEGAKSGDTSKVSGSARSDVHTIAQSGLVATNGKTSSSSRVINTTTGSEQGEYTITFDVKALEDTLYINRTADAATSTMTAGVVYTVYLDGQAVELTSGEASSLFRAVKSVSGDTSDYYIVREGATRTFTLQVSIDPVVTGYYSVELSQIRFDADKDGVANDSVYTVPTTKEFETNAEQLNG